MCEMSVQEKVKWLMVWPLLAFPLLIPPRCHCFSPIQNRGDFIEPGKNRNKTLEHNTKNITLSPPYITVGSSIEVRNHVHLYSRASMCLALPSFLSHPWHRLSKRSSINGSPDSAYSVLDWGEFKFKTTMEPVRRKLECNENIQTWEPVTLIIEHSSAREAKRAEKLFPDFEMSLCLFVCQIFTKVSAKL